MPSAKQVFETAASATSNTKTGELPEGIEEQVIAY